MPQEVHGNIAGVRETQLAELAAIYDCPFDTDEFAPRELLEELWPHGMGKFEYFDTQEDGAKRLAHYLAKQRRAGRWWSHSRNLKEPPRTVSNRKVSRRRLMRIAEDVRKDGREILRELYPGFKPVEIVVKYSDFAPGAYIYARMRREEDTAPPWERIRTKPPRGGGK